ncbi:MAG TPA: hypothetical protein VHC70_13710 [Phycisphaerales bacterium]|nr:hypothetical protein [Phycisphaerales bacterium]
MKPQWALQLDPRHTPAAAGLRAFAGVDVCPTADALWLRGPCDGAAIERTMWLIPGLRYRIDAAGKLVPWGNLLPVARLPEGAWMPLSEFLQPAFAAPALPGQVADRVTLRCVRTAREEPPALLLLDAATWAHYIDHAPAIRLARLQFALSSAGAVLVRGTPLPSLPGTPFTLDAAIACPCGYTWSPAVKASALSESLQLQKEEIALLAWHQRPADVPPLDAGTLSCQVIPASAWIPVSRSAVRISLQGLPA